MISLQDNLIDKKEYESLCNALVDTFMKRKVNLFYEKYIKICF